MDARGPHTDPGWAPPSLNRTPLIVFTSIALFLLAVLGGAFVLFALGEDQPAIVAVVDATATPTPQPTVILIGNQTPTPSPTATPTAPPPATAPAEQSTEPTPTHESEPTSQPEPELPNVMLVLLPEPEELPTLADLPEGFAVVREGPLTAEELAELHPDPAAQLARLREWGFVQAARREYEPVRPGAVDVYFFAAGVIEFGSPEQARQAIEFGHAEAIGAAETQMRDVPVDLLGDMVLAADGTVVVADTTSTAAYVFVQIGNRAYTFLGLGTAESPMPLVLEIARNTVRKSS